MHVGVKALAKRIFFGAAASAPAIGRKLEKLRASGRLTILNFHRVGPDDRSTYPPLSPSLFEETMRFCGVHFTIVTFGELAGLRSNGKPPLILSFDDGYQDFADFAAPILRRHGLRCNINLIPACIESGKPPLNVQLQDFVGRATPSKLAMLQVPGFGPIDDPDRERLGQRLSNFVKFKPIAEQKTLASALAPHLEDSASFATTPMMDLRTVQGISATHEIGAHSFEHATLSCEDDEYVRWDAQACARYIAEKLGRATDIYAVPNGGIRPGIEPILRDAGFKHVLLTGDDYSRPDALSHRRFGMYGDSAAELRFRATGFVRH